MNSKVSSKTENLDNTKITSIITYRNGDFDITKVYRREEMLRKKLKAILETNNQFEKEIKNHDCEIRDERGSIAFQLNQLIREMSGKSTSYTQDKLEKHQFANNEISHATIQSMMQKYEKIEIQSKLIKKIYNLLDGIQQNYTHHANEMNAMVMSMEETNREYENNMDEVLQSISIFQFIKDEQIKAKIQENDSKETQTQHLIKSIDDMDAHLVQLKHEEVIMAAKIDKIKASIKNKTKDIEGIQEWTNLAIDKSNRKLVCKQIQVKSEQLTKLQQKNHQLEIYYYQLENQQSRLQAQNKENATSAKKAVAMPSRNNAKKSATQTGRTVKQFKGNVSKASGKNSSYQECE